MMKPFSSIVVVVIVFLCFINSTTLSQPADYYQIVQTWGNSYCSSRTCSNPGAIPQNFTMHGLWPAFNNGTPFTDCPNKYVMTNFTETCKGFLPEMNSFWPTLTFTSNPKFWAYEWMKHGTCSLFSNPTSYFMYGKDLKKFRSPLDLLAAKKIVPGSSSFYNVAAIEAAIEVRTGGNRVALTCVKKNRQYYLSEIYMCVDLIPGQSVKSIPCPSTARSSCGFGKVGYPSTTV